VRIYPTYKIAADLCLLDSYAGLLSFRRWAADLAQAWFGP